MSEPTPPGGGQTGDADAEAPTSAPDTPLTTDDEAQRHDTPAEPDTEAS